MEENIEKEEEIPSDLECTICIRLLYRPVTTPCGHNFCAACLSRSIRYRPSCPICRSAILGAGNLNILLWHLIRERYPRHTALRELQDFRSIALADAAERSAHERLSRDVPMAVFAMEVESFFPIFPTEVFRLRIFEPKFIELIHEVTQGSRRFVMIPSCAIPKGKAYSRTPAGVGTAAGPGGPAVKTSPVQVTETEVAGSAGSSCNSCTGSGDRCHARNPTSACSSSTNSSTSGSSFFSGSSTSSSSSGSGNAGGPKIDLMSATMYAVDGYDDTGSPIYRGVYGAIVEVEAVSRLPQGHLLIGCVVVHRVIVYGYADYHEIGAENSTLLEGGRRGAIRRRRPPRSSADSTHSSSGDQNTTISDETGILSSGVATSSIHTDSTDNTGMMPTGMDPADTDTNAVNTPPLIAAGSTDTSTHSGDATSSGTRNGHGIDPPFDSSGDYRLQRRSYEITDKYTIIKDVPISDSTARTYISASCALAILPIQMTVLKPPSLSFYDPAGDLQNEPYATAHTRMNRPARPRNSTLEGTVDDYPNGIVDGSMAGALNSTPAGALNSTPAGSNTDSIARRGADTNAEEVSLVGTPTRASSNAIAPAASSALRASPVSALSTSAPAAPSSSAPSGVPLAELIDRYNKAIAVLKQRLLVVVDNNAAQCARATDTSAARIDGATDEASYTANNAPISRIDTDPPDETTDNTTSNTIDPAAHLFSCDTANGTPDEAGNNSAISATDSSTTGNRNTFNNLSSIVASLTERSIFQNSIYSGLTCSETSSGQYSTDRLRITLELATLATEAFDQVLGQCGPSFEALYRSANRDKRPIVDFSESGVTTSELENLSLHLCGGSNGNLRLLSLWFSTTDTAVRLASLARILLIAARSRAPHICRSIIKPRRGLDRSSTISRYLIIDNLNKGMILLLVLLLFLLFRGYFNYVYRSSSTNLLDQFYPGDDDGTIVYSNDGDRGRLSRLQMYRDL